MVISQLSNEDNLQKYSNMIADKIRNGFVIEEKNDKLPFAVLSKEPQPVDHGLNFMISCMTFGLWTIPWIYQTYVSSREKKILIAIDEDGNTFEENCYID